jgi:hypothetical protein
MDTRPRLGESLTQGTRRAGSMPVEPDGAGGFDCQNGVQGELMLIGHSNSTLLKPKALYLKTKKSHHLNKII